MLDKFLIEECGFEQCPVEPRLYQKKYADGKIIYLEVHTDDAAILADEGLESELDELIKFIKSKFDITDLGKLRHYLGIRVQYDATSTTLDQEAYLTTILSELLENAQYKRRTPWDPELDTLFDDIVDPTPEDQAYMKTRNYWRLVGKLQYLVHTRPDISYATSKLARFATRPRRIHWEAAQRVLAYLAQTSDFRLCYNKSGNTPTLESFSDADYAGDKSTRRSTTGVVIRVGGTSVISVSKRQQVIADSTTAAETIALHHASREVMWSRHLMNWFGYDQSMPTTMYCDNQAATHIAQEGAERSKLKHLDVKYMKIKEYTKKKQVVVKDLRTQDMVADINTKGLPWGLFENHRASMGLTKGSIWDMDHQSVNREQK